jgi:hypothetical protein
MSLVRISWRGIRLILASPFALLMFVGLLLMWFGALVIDKLLPGDNVFALFLQNSVGFNKYPVDISARDVS